MLSESPDVPLDDHEVDSAPVITDRVILSLLFNQRLSAERADQLVVEAAKRPGVPLWRLLVEDPEVDRDVVFREAAAAYAFREITVPQVAAAAFVRENLTAFSEKQWERMRALGVVPVARTPATRTARESWTFGTFDPLNGEVTRLLESISKASYKLGYLSETVVREIIEEVFPKRNEYLDKLRDEEYTQDLDAEEGLMEAGGLEAEIEAQIKQSALLTLFEGMILEAVRQKASDIHVRPNAEGHLAIHFRVDGQLRQWYTEERVYPEAFLAVVKDKARGVDRFERAMAQDGYLQRVIDDEFIRFRVSVLPMAGRDPAQRLESIVLRVLDDRNSPDGLAQLGLNPKAMERFAEAIAQPHGLVVVTGPTGSGKTTTLHAALREVVTPTVNAITVEDPVEYLLPDVVQVKLSHKLDLEGALRAILRHDPDIVMVGEMRDRDTAELAIKLANTGHLSFSTLHTNDAPSAVSRLYKMGVEPFLIANAINLVMAQRLVRLLCPDCKVPDPEPDTGLLRRMGLPEEQIASATFFVPGKNAKCKNCQGHGYSGRRAVAEVLPFTEAVRDEISEAGGGVDEEVLRKIAADEGLPTLGEVAIGLACEGVTSIVEARRTVFLR